MSRGTAKSTMNIGRRLRALIARSTMPKPTIGSWLAVLVMTISNSARRSGNSDNRIALPRKFSAKSWPRSKERLAIVIEAGLCAAKCSAHKAIISPAPMNKTC